MKVFILALVILALISTLTFALSFYTIKKADFFLDSVEKISVPNEKRNLSYQQQAYKELIASWEKCSFIMSVSNPRVDLLNIEECFASVIGCCKANDTAALQIEAKRLTSLFENLKKNSQLSPKNIF